MNSFTTLTRGFAALLLSGVILATAACGTQTGHVSDVPPGNNAPANVLLEASTSETGNSHDWQSAAGKRIPDAMP